LCLGVIVGLPAAGIVVGAASVWVDALATDKDATVANGETVVGVVAEASFRSAVIVSEIEIVEA